MEAVKAVEGSKTQAANRIDLVAVEARVGQRNGDMAAAQAVDQMIAALPNSYELTPGDRAAVEGACAAFEALTQDQKQQVTRSGKLLFAEAKMRMLAVDMAAASAVDHTFAALPPAAQLTIFDLQDIIDARTAYEALERCRQRPLVTKLAVLEAAEARLPELYAVIKAIRAVDDLIAQIPSSLQFTDRPCVEAARNAYEALTQVQKQYVRRLDRLEAAEAAMERLETPYLLETAKDEAFYALFSGLNEADYSPENRMHMRDARTSGYIAIQTAGTAAEVRTARDAALSTMYAIPKAAYKAPEALVTTKAAARGALDASLSAIDSINYSPKDWAILAAYKANGDADIEAANTIDAIYAAGDAALSAMYAVPTSIAV